MDIVPETISVVAVGDNVGAFVPLGGVVSVGNIIWSGSVLPAQAVNNSIDSSNNF